MKTVISAEVIDFATAVQSLRLRRRRSELQRLRAAYAVRTCGALPAAWTRPSAAAGRPTAPAVVHVVAR